MSVDRRSLVATLREQLALLESDLGRQSLQPYVDHTLRERWHAEREADRTAQGYETWRAEQVTQGAMAWVLATVLIRFCEDNGLIPDPFLVGPRERPRLAEERQASYRRSQPDAARRLWILEGLAEVNAGGVVAPLLDPSGWPMEWLGPSDGAAEELISFWRIRKDGAGLDFADQQLGTGFLGILYQDLSEQQRAKYALLETPGFIVGFILDHSFESAIAEFGLDGLRTIDPVCGSGTFLLEAFQRLLQRQGATGGAMASPELVRRCLRSVHGVDKNPVAVAIARFRLLVAAIRALGVRAMSEAPVSDLVVAAEDSLLSGRGAPHPADGLFGPEDRPGLTELGDNDLLGAGSYHAVFGNPPYITPKDKAEDAAYRAAYPDCIGQYALTVPFIERFFGLGREGHVGLLVANSFMKREFGRRLVERFLPVVDLTQVIDTSGVFIPGHGTPTVILLGRSGQPRLPGVEVVTNLRGEPEVPADPARGKVWRAILGGYGHAPYRDEWVQVRDVNRTTLSSFPWNLADKVSSDVLGKMERGARLGDRTLRIGYYASTGSDDIFTAPPASFRRINAERERVIPVITGSEVRDWQVLSHDEGALFSEADKGLDVGAAFPVHMRRLWPYRTVLEQRRSFSGRSYLDDGRPWYSWHQITQTPDAHPWPIVFSWVSTHNHFAVLRRKAAPLNSAPVIRLPRTASDSDVVQLAALLNSSLACFWLKQFSNSKGQPRADQTGTGEPWTLFYEFTAARLAEFPLPPDRWSGDRWSTHAGELDRLAQELTASTPRNLLRPGAMVTTVRLDEGRSRWEGAYARIIALQEELDWEIYERYGLVDSADEFSAPDDIVPGLAPGERAFEIALARRVASGEAETTWFERHAIEPATAVPSHWPTRYKAVVENRIRAIRHMPMIGAVERPEFKRRWASGSWDEQEKDAIQEWLLDRCEQRDLWYRSGPEDKRQPCPLTDRELAERLCNDDNVRSMAKRIAGAEAEPSTLIAEVVRDECVPYLAALRYSETGLGHYAQWTATWRSQADADEGRRRAEPAMPPRYRSGDFLKYSYWRLRGKYDVPNERFISYPNVSQGNELLLGWAGWNPSDQARVIVDLIEGSKRCTGNSAESIVPLLAGLRDVLPRLTQWHEFEERSFVEYLDREQHAHGLSDDHLASWRPPKPKRGRPRKRP